MTQVKLGNAVPVGKASGAPLGVTSGNSASTIDCQAGSKSVARREIEVAASAPLYSPSEFCRTCRGNRGHREPSTHDPRNTVWTPCPDCSGTGWNAGAVVEQQESSK